jgi:hypothetical protein
MSSKTTFKRIALVAVAGLGLGVLSVAPSSATINADTLTLSAATAAQTTAETSTATSAVATVSFLGAVGDSLTVTASLVSGPAGNTALPQLTLSETSSATVSATDVASNTPVSVQAISASAATTAKFKVYLGTSATAAPTVAGTYVVKLTPATVGTSGALQAATAQTLTITVTTAATLDKVAASATSIINAGETNTASTDAVVTSSKSVSASTSAATIKVSLLNAAGSAVTAESFTATISGPGTLGSAAMAGAADNGASATGRAITVRNGDVVGVFPDGTSGVSTITISSAAGKILATETVTFFGSATTLVVTVKKAVIGGTTAVADVLAINAKDAAGVDVSNLTSFGVVSSDTTKIATAYGTAKGSYDATTGLYLIPVTPVAAGSSNLTVTTNASSADTTGISAAAVAVRVGSKTPASLKVTLDKTSYLPGEKATITVALADSSALDLVSSETYTAIFATGGITSNYSLGNGSATTSGTDVVSYASAGKTYTVFMPVMDGDLTFSWTSGTGVATANQGVAGTITVPVKPSSASADAATDAANEATDAANAATDAALAAADAADAATAAAQDASDAVAALSATVAKLVASLKAQITSLTNLVIKIQKKVKA